MTDIIEVMAKGALEEASSLDPRQWMTAALKAAKAEGWELVRLPDSCSDLRWHSERRIGHNHCLNSTQRLELEP